MKYTQADRRRMGLTKPITFLLTCWLAMALMGCNDKYGAPSVEVSIDTIKIDFGNYDVNSSEVISEYEMVYLDSDSLLVGSISRLYITDSLILVADIPSNRIYRFNRAGKIEFYIDQLGYGPEEYSEMKDVGINHSDGTIEVLDLPTQSVVRYDLKTGEFVDKVKYGFWTSTFSPLPGGGRLFHHGTIPNYETTEKGGRLDAGVYITDARNEVKSTFLNRAELGFDRVRLITLRNAFPDYQNGVNYVPLYQNTIFKASDDGLKPTYYLDFGSRTLPEGFLLTFQGDYRDFPKFLNNSGYANSTSHFYESGSHITFTFHSHRGYQKVIYDKRSGNSIAYRTFNRDNSLININPKGVYEDYHVSIASFESLNFRKRFFEGKLSEEKRATIPEYQRLKSALDDNHGQNPILVFTKFKAIE